MTFIQKTKEFFNKKSVRIFIALLIIAGILTGVSIGIIALVRKVQDPCINETGKSWNDELKMCVEDNCKNLCKKNNDTSIYKKGQCVDENYCKLYDEKNSVHYKFDSEKCACIGSCTEPNEFARTPEGDESTNMIKDPRTGEYYPPKDKAFTCGKFCKFTNSGICRQGNQCGIQITENGTVLSAGCQDMKKCNPDDDQDPIMCNLNSNLVCSQSEDKITVIKNDPMLSQFHLNDDIKTNYYCSNTFKCGETDQNEKKICRLKMNTESGNEDCEDSDGNLHSCIKSSTFENKGYMYLGVCDSKGSYFHDTSTCKLPIKVGEQQGTDNSGLFDLMYEVNEIDSEGISLNQPQCVHDAKCKSSNLGPKWYCKVNNTDCTHGPPVSTPEGSVGEPASCSDSPPYSTREAYDLNCCEKGRVSNLGSRSFCCPADSVTIGDQKLCLNTSKYKPNSSWLEDSSLEGFMCNSDKDCRSTSARDSLIDKLGYNAQYTSSNEGTYSDLYCDTDNQCKFFAGYIDKVVNSTEVEYDAQWMIANNNSTYTSQASYMSKNEHKFSGDPKEEPLGTASLKFCSNNEDIQRFAVYDKDLKPTAQRDLTDYTHTLTAYARNDTPLSEVDCLNYAKYSLPRAYFTSETGSSATIGNDIQLNTDSSGLEYCTFKADCIAPSFNTIVYNKSGDKKSASHLKWNFSADDIKKLGKNYLYDSDGHAIKFVGHPLNMYGSNLECAPRRETCETLAISNTEWSDLEDHFVKTCIMKDGICRQNTEMAKYMLNPSSTTYGTSSNSEQYCHDGWYWEPSLGSYTC